MTHVFVYGTLRRGGTNHRLLAELGGQFVSEVRTRVGRTLVDLGPYPALLPLDVVRDASASPVHGELFAVEPAALVPLDAFEGCPTLYFRERVALADGHRSGAHEAWTYVLAARLAARLPGGARVLENGRYEG